VRNIAAVKLEIIERVAGLLKALGYTEESLLPTVESQFPYLLEALYIRQASDLPALKGPWPLLANPC